MLKSFKNYSVAIATALTMVLTAGASLGATVVYSDNPSWTAATSSQTAITFTAPSAGITDYGTSSGLVLSGASFIGYLSGSTYQLATVDSLFASPYYNFGIGASLRGPVSDRPNTGAFLPYLHVVLPAGVTAIATDLMTGSPNALPVRVTIAGGSTFTVSTQNRPVTTFFGLTSDTPIAYVDFALPTSTINGSSVTLLKDFQYATGAAPTPPSDTPEAATLILIGTGLVVFRYMKNKGLASGFTHA